MTPSVATHAIGVMTSVLSPLLHRHCAVLDDGGGPDAVLRAVHEEQVTHLLVGPSGYDALLDDLGPDGPIGAPPSLRMIALGGAPLARGVLRKADRLPAVLRIHWGMTEVPGGGVSRGREVPGTSWHTMGHPVPGLERELCPVEGAVEGVGEVRVRGPQVTVGLVDSGDGRVVWSPRDDDGWYATGDLARHDETGELAFLERDSDEIKGSSGMLIPTGEVEDLLADHPDVAEVVLVAFHPSEQAEAPAAVVVAAPGRTPTLEGLQQHLRDRGTTEWYLPARLETIERMPRDASGKVDKKALREQVDA
jgi:cyclohexanecarboxylate-CoA ligase